MSAPKINVPEGYALLIGVGVVGFIVLANYLKKQASAAASAIANVNAGTPYEGAGVVGTLGNAVNQTLGGAPQSIGEAIGGWLADIFQPYDPNAPADPTAQANDSAAVTRQAAVVDNFGVLDPSTWGGDAVGGGSIIGGGQSLQP
jgi:hypothetical protein